MLVKVYAKERLINSSLPLEMGRCNQVGKLFSVSKEKWGSFTSDLRNEPNLRTNLVSPLLPVERFFLHNLTSTTLGVHFKRLALRHLR